MKRSRRSSVEKQDAPAAAAAAAVAAAPAAGGGGGAAGSGAAASRPYAELYVAPPPTRSADGRFHFAGVGDFNPNRSPWEVLQAGAFGGGYFRTIHSSVTGKTYEGAWKEFAPHLGDLKISKFISNPVYNKAVNKYGEKCGQGLDAWEASGWITKWDPFGWFHWYCRFFLGRRCEDDARQISRWRGVAGANGRWKLNLIGKCLSAGKAHDDASVSPVVRQTLLHWAYELSAADMAKSSSRTAFPFYVPPAGGGAGGGGGAASSSASARAASPAPPAAPKRPRPAPKKRS